MNDETRSGFLGTLGLSRLRRVWRGLAGTSGDKGDVTFKPDLPDTEYPLLDKQLRACLEAHGGEVSARRRAVGLGQAYLSLNNEGRVRFLKYLACEFAKDSEAVDAAARILLDAKDAPGRALAEAKLSTTLIAPRRTLLTQFNALPEGVKFLVDMRAELMPLARQDSDLKGLEDDLKSLLVTWFDVGFLEMKRITWESPAALLEKLIAYEAVHAITSWDDLKNRLDSDRRLFAFFHPRMPDEPLIFVEVALVSGISNSVQALLDEDAPVLDPEKANTAIFYSISNAQSGLAGISFGNFLIKRVVDHLSREFPNLKNFATLSPVPGFSKWLTARLAEDETDLMSATERKALQSLGEGARGSLKRVLDDPTWPDDETRAGIVSSPLKRLCARYLSEEKGRGGLRAVDPVAHFHLTNGARIERLNWLGDRSAKGLAESAGIMINYLYKLKEIDGNHEAYSDQGNVRMSSEFKGLLKG